MKIFISFFSILLAFQIVAQTGGNYAFPILDLSFDARTTGLGTRYITAIDQDTELGIYNPSLYNKAMHNHASFSHGFLPTGVNFGMATYSRNFGEKFSSAASIRYMSYGVQDRMTPEGIQIGTFHPGDFVLGVGTSYEIIENFKVGANFNFLLSQLDRYIAIGSSLDLAASYYVDKANLVLTVNARNIGYQFKNYTNSKRSNLPADLQFGISHRLKHAPFRFSMVIHHLNKPDLSYFDPKTPPTYDPLMNDTIYPKGESIGVKIAQHLTFQVELLLGKVVQVRAAYDVYQRTNLKVKDRSGVSGFSFGLGLYFKKFAFNYGINFTSVAGMQNMFTLSTNIDQWKKKQIVNTSLQ